VAQAVGPSKGTRQARKADEQYEADSAQPAAHSTKVARDSTQPQDTTQFRRSVPRQPVDWVARFRLHEDPTGYWRACRISDISTAGAGLKLAVRRVVRGTRRPDYRRLGPVGRRSPQHRRRHRQRHQGRDRICRSGGRPIELRRITQAF